MWMAAVDEGGRRGGGHEGAESLTGMRSGYIYLAGSMLGRDGLICWCAQAAKRTGTKETRGEALRGVFGGGRAAGAARGV